MLVSYPGYSYHFNGGNTEQIGYNSATIAHEHEHDMVDAQTSACLRKGQVLC